MFTQARLKLTAWYLLIIAFISTLFSTAVYRGLTIELGRGLRLQALRLLPRPDYLSPATRSSDLDEGFFMPFMPTREPVLSLSFDRTVYEEAKHRIALYIMLINGGIIVIAGFAAYFLAGKTLKPIEKMVEEQKRFIADASHELRTPLTSLKTEIEVGLRDHSLTLAQAKNLLVSNLEEVNKIQSLSNHLLTLSRYQKTADNHSFTQVYLLQVITESQRKLETLIKAKNIHIKTEGKNVKIEANAVSVQELIAIVLDNAIKYSHKDGLIHIKIGKAKQMAYISVQDFGIGIKSTELPYIFNRFYRADTSRTKTHTDGYGLGLAIAKNIVDMHEGGIQVQSRVDKGSTFTITLPLTQIPQSTTL